MHTKLKNLDNSKIEIKWDVFKYEDIVLNIDQVRTWCKEGCSNFNNNGGCPPFSPTAEEFLKEKEFILLTCKIYTNSVSSASWEEKSAYIENTLRNFTDNLGYKIKDLYNVDFLGAGYCRGCSKCSIHSNCSASDRRAYCITGTGIMLGDVLERLFNEKLQWFKDGTEPEYTMKVMGFISDKNSTLICEELNNIIN